MSTLNTLIRDEIELTLENLDADIVDKLRPHLTKISDDAAKLIRLSFENKDVGREIAHLKAQIENIGVANSIQAQKILAEAAGKILKRGLVAVAAFA